MLLTKNHLAILRRLTIGSSGTTYGLSKQLTLEKALIENMVRQLEGIGLLRKADKDLLKITDNGQRVLMCIARNETYDHLLPAQQPASQVPEKSAQVIDETGKFASQQTANQPEQDQPALMQRVLMVLFKAGKSVGISKTAEQVNASHKETKAALDHLAELGHVKKYDGGNYYIKSSGRELVSKNSVANFPAAMKAAINQAKGNDADEIAANAAATVKQLETDKQLLQEITDSQLKTTDSTTFNVTAIDIEQFAEQLTENSRSIAEAICGCETIDVDAEASELLVQGLVKSGSETLHFNESANSKTLLDTELTALAEMLDPNQFPVIDDIDSKQHALAGIAVLLKQRTPALANLAEQLSTDLSVIRLHQDRRA